MGNHRSNNARVYLYVCMYVCIPFDLRVRRRRHDNGFFICFVVFFRFVYVYNVSPAGSTNQGAQRTAPRISRFGFVWCVPIGKSSCGPLSSLIGRTRNRRPSGAPRSDLRNWSRTAYPMQSGTPFVVTWELVWSRQKGEKIVNCLTF